MGSEQSFLLFWLKLCPNYPCLYPFPRETSDSQGIDPLKAPHMTYFEPFPHHSLISETLSLCPLKFTVHYQQNSLYAQSLLRVFPSPFSKANLAHPLWGCCCPHNLLRDFVPLDLQVGEGSSFAPHCFFQAILLLSKSSPCSVIFFF